MKKSRAWSDAKTVLVLGGGGGRGAAQIGVLRALAERGVTPNAVVGTSVGALNAAAVAGLPFAEAVDALEEIWASPQTAGVFRSEILRVAINRVRRRPWLRSGQCLTDLVDYALDKTGLTTFENLRVPLEVIVTNLDNGEPHVIRSGGLRDPLRASCSIPGVFPSVTLGDAAYVDGGVTENCSLATAAELTPTRIIAIDLSADTPPTGPPRFGDIMGRVIQVAQHARVVADFDRFNKRFPVTVICPRLSLGNVNVGEFGNIIREARSATETLLQSIIQPDGVLSSGLYYVPVPAV